MSQGRYFLLDCETGGTDTQNSLLSLYGKILNGKLEEQGDIHLYTKPNPNENWVVKSTALQVNKINLLEHEQRAITYDEASSKFYNFIFKHTLGQRKLIPVGKNVQFDVKFSKKYLLNDWSRYFEHRLLDITSIAQFLKLVGKLPQDCPCSLSSLVEHFGIKVNPSLVHTEKYDVEITLLVLKRLMTLVR